jgi:hypothetical protein
MPNNDGNASMTDDAAMVRPKLRKVNNCFFRFVNSSLGGGEAAQEEVDVGLGVSRQFTVKTVAGGFIL